MVHVTGTRTIGGVQGEQGQGNQESGLTAVCPLTGESILTLVADRIINDVCRIRTRYGVQRAYQADRKSVV